MFLQNRKLANTNFRAKTAASVQDASKLRQGTADGKVCAPAALISEGGVYMAVAAAIGVTVGFALLRSVVRRAAIRSGRCKKE